MEQSVIIECWSCRIVYPGQAKCEACGGRGMLKRAARMVDAGGSHALLKQALARIAEGSAAKRREALIEALIHWQIYGVGYVGIEYGATPDSPAFKRAHLKLRDRLVTAIKKADREL